MKMTTKKIPFEIKAVKTGTSNPIASIRITGTIGWDNDPEEFRKEVDSLIKEGITDCHIYINSPGGSCFAANEIVNIIQQFNGSVTGEGGALVASAATYIALHCDTFSMPENGNFMLHKPTGVIEGTSNDMASYLTLLKNMENEYLKTYQGKAVDIEELKTKWEAGDWWMTATEAYEKGFITSVTLKTDKQALPVPNSYNKIFTNLSSDERIILRQTNPQLYAELYKKEYGFIPSGLYRDLSESLPKNVTIPIPNLNNKKFADLNSDERISLKATNPQLYAKLFHDEYGFSPRI